MILRFFFSTLPHPPIGTLTVASLYMMPPVLLSGWTFAFGIHKQQTYPLQRSLKRHAALNAQEKHFESKARYGINKFSDWSEEEFRGRLNLLLKL